VTEGESLELNASVENLGDLNGTQTIELRRNGELLDSEEVEELPGDNTTVVTFDGIDTEVGDAPEIAFTVASDNTSATTIQPLNAEDEFTVSINETNDPVTFDETLNVSVDVENIGDIKGTRRVEVRLNGNADSRSVTLTGGEARTLDFQVDASEGDNRVFASTGDDLDARSVQINDPAFFEVDVVEAFSDLEVVEGENATVTLDIENTGGVNATQNVSLELVEVGNESNVVALDNVSDVELEDGGFNISEPTVDTDAFGVEPGEYTLQAENEDGEVFEAEQNFTVLEPASFSATIEAVNGEAPPIDDKTSDDAFA
ncbi:hypothetical protein DVK07_19685, partial [Halorubrum sp. Atlit-26R]